MLFVMAEKNIYADALGKYLWKTKEFRLKESEVLVIHTDAAGEVTKKDLDKAREAARDIDVLHFHQSFRHSPDFVQTWVSPFS